MKKSWGLASLFAVPFALARPVAEVVGDVWNGVLSVGNLSWLGLSDTAVIHGVTRILIWILIFTIFYAVMTGFRGREGRGVLGFLTPRHSAIVAFCVATISAIFIPVSVLFAIGGGFATLVAAGLIGGPIIGFGYLLTRIPGAGRPETRGTILLKVFLCLLIFWIITAMRYHLGQVTGGVVP